MGSENYDEDHMPRIPPKPLSELTRECPLYVLDINARNSRIAALASRRAAIISADRSPCRHRARRLRSRPSIVRGPVLAPPCSRQRPFGIAAAWQGLPVRLDRAPHRGAAFRQGKRLQGARMGSIAHF